ncbi:prolyl oligopeptidase family serine peptidase [Flavivirga jejuensis]|uniref:prolyl oligopeptidase n=1 Tax=Flavivirga jejuensis TaxID=870487 RepID=A0ABT8WW04_9FLAO|nr:prolyl oligopeptidase family serine peptidase [Flavivirga jejuensis]MDO5977169.1 prolyl oligopeptidase family serine peptidase [Flavivirga jejuensis]
MKKIQFIIILFILVSCVKYSTDIEIYNPPIIKGELVVDHYYGKEIIDRYRNLENINDSVNINWYKNQDIYAENLLRNISGRNSLIKTLSEIDNRESFRTSKIKITENNTWFYLKRNVEESYYKLYYKKNENESLLFDPKSFKPESKEDYVINYISPSWDANFIVVSLSHSGRELSEMIIIDMKTKKPMPQVLNNAWPTNFLGVSWLPDNSGFIFLYFPGSDISNPKFKQNSQSVLYLLNNKPNDLRFVFGNKSHPKLNINPNEYPIAKIKSSTDKYLLGYVAGVDSYWNTFYAEISDIKKGKLNWKPLYSKEQKVVTNKGVFLDNEFVFLSAQNAPNKKIASVTINELNFKKPKVIAKERKTEIINDFEVTKNAIFYTTQKYGVQASLYKISDGIEINLKTPKKAGEISLYAKSINHKELWISTSGWVNDDIRYKYISEDNSFLEDNLSPKSEYPEFKNIIAEEVLVTSHDGKEVPLSIIYNKNIKRDSKNPVFVYAYGAYGDIESPYFSPLMLNFVANGGIFCISHVRGGGEKGENWHEDGFKTTKSNSWKDLIACTEYLIDEKFTSKNHTAIYGASAGGIVVGRAMTERPDLFSVVISQAGLMNPLRAEAEAGGGGSNYKEFGTVKDSIECMGLIEMDSYLHIRDSIDYPATYMTIGMNDPLVNPWMTGKFIARLQNSNMLKKPVLLNIDFNSGHNGTNNELKIYEEWADIFSFILWQTGHPEYQLENTEI